MKLEDQIKVAERELALRKNVYPKWVESGKMKQEEARHQLMGMEAIVMTLRDLRTLINNMREATNETP